MHIKSICGLLLYQTGSFSAIDGNHKLVRWRIVIHGAIDGHSRLVLYLHCADNNRASTVLSCFERAIKDYGIPHRIRTDRGGENVDAARLMLTLRGLETRCVLTGSSVHNQRIERLWRDVFTAVTHSYYLLFYAMEEHGYLDPLNELHLFALHFVFIPRIRRSLTIFKNGWNSHKVRTTGKSPQQMFTTSRIQHLTMGEVNDCYGIDEDGPIPAVDDSEGVAVPPVQVVLSQEVTDRLSSVDPLVNSASMGFNVYNEVLQIVS